jgi:hemoglobin-like flavoprotein
MSDEEHNSALEDEEEEDELNAALAGEDALVLVADTLHQKLQADADFEKYMKDVDLEGLAVKFRNFLSGVFGSNDWPEISGDLNALDEAYPDFASVLLELMESDTEDIGTAMDKMSQMREDDDRLQRFDESLRSTATADDQGKEGVGDGGSEDGADDQKGSAGQEIDIHSFNKLVLEESYIEAAADAWKLFISMAASREAAGEAIYTALFESVPSMQYLFTTPSAVQAIRLMVGLQGVVDAVSDPARLKTLVETLGFAHMQYDITPARVVSARDAFIDLFMLELADRFTRQAREAWVRLFNYIGGAIIFTKSNYADRISTLVKSWNQANKGDEGERQSESLADSEEREQNELRRLDTMQAQKDKGAFSFLKSKKKDESIAGTDKENHGGKHTKEGDIGAQTVPTTYLEMFKFNAAVMGFGTSAWMNEVLAVFDNIVQNISNTSRFQEECEVLTLRIARVTKGTVNFAEYKSCMLASLRSLLPKDWDTAHEVAWSWLWENVERSILKNHGQPPNWERALAQLFAKLDEEQKFEIRKDFYKTFFSQAPTGQDFFKQSNTYLHFISEKVINMTLEMYQNPVKMTDDLSAVGLLMWGMVFPLNCLDPL